MIKNTLSWIFLCFSVISSAQERSFAGFLADSSIEHASVSFCLIDATSGNTVYEKNSGVSLIPGSLMKLVTTSAAIELLGSDYRFKTSVGFTGTIDKRSGRLDGDIIIKGGGDPVLGSGNFDKYYDGFIDKWVLEIKKLGIREIKGRIVTDDSFYDYQPVPAKWLWEDAGNYYGAGAFGLSVFDNTYEIHLRTLPDSNNPVITEIMPAECSIELDNRLSASGTEDQGYVFTAPYSKTGWIEGTIPVRSGNFILSASIPDPPLLIAEILDRELEDSGVKISGEPSTSRLMQSEIIENVMPVTEIFSPPLKEIIEVLNHMSINLYAEHLVKELGRVYRNSGTTRHGLEVINEFLQEKGINKGGMFMEDGSGLSALDAVSSGEITSLLLYMKNKGKYFNEFYASLPDPGREGTFRNYFKDPIFESHLKAKSGSMTRVRAYAGYIAALSGKELIFCIIVNNFTGTSNYVISGIEEILKETILNK